MEKLDISMWAILKISLSGIFIYIIAPALLVCRDLILLKIIEKFILTKNLTSNIRLCESDRWQMKKLGEIKAEIKIPVSGGDTKYLLNGNEVSKSDFDLHQNTLGMHSTRFHQLNASINMRHNLILWLTKHYKQENLNSPIPKLRERAYEQESSSGA